MRQTGRPSNNQKCARKDCGHEFGVHFIAHDGKTIGCASALDPQRDGFHPCQCDGFLIAYTYPATPSRA